MTRAWCGDLDELDGDGDLAERRAGGPPERSNRRGVVRNARKTARRSRSNEVAKRGMHQRRNKRVSW
jgi:hypothetical protein